MRPVFALTLWHQGLSRQLSCLAAQAVVVLSTRVCRERTDLQLSVAGALELAGNLPAFSDSVCHATINVDELDPACQLPGLVLNQPREIGRPSYILNNSFGMLGINSVVIIKRI